MSRTKRKSVWYLALRRGQNWKPGNPVFDKYHPDMSDKKFEENYRMYGCRCARCRQIHKRQIIKNIHKQEIENFRKGLE